MSEQARIRRIANEKISQWLEEYHTVSGGCPWFQEDISPVDAAIELVRSAGGNEPPHIWEPLSTDDILAIVDDLVERFPRAGGAK
jgi:hypothetical protein